MLIKSNNHSAVLKLSKYFLMQSKNLQEHTITLVEFHIEWRCVSEIDIPDMEDRMCKLVSSIWSYSIVAIQWVGWIPTWLDASSGDGSKCSHWLFLQPVKDTLKLPFTKILHYPMLKCNVFMIGLMKPGNDALIRTDSHSFYQG